MQIDRQTNRQIDRQTDRQTLTQRDGCTAGTWASLIRIPQESADNGYIIFSVLISTTILYPLVHTFYRVGGRSKEIIVTAGGENVAPIPIEDAIKVEIKHILSLNRFTDFFVYRRK